MSSTVGAAEGAPGSVETSPGVVVSVSGVVGSGTVSSAGVAVAGIVSGLTTGTCSAVVVPGTVFTATAPVVLGAGLGVPGTPSS